MMEVVTWVLAPDDGDGYMGPSPQMMVVVTWVQAPDDGGGYMGPSTR